MVCLEKGNNLIRLFSSVQRYTYQIALIFNIINFCFSFLIIKFTNLIYHCVMFYYVKPYLRVLICHLTCEINLEMTGSR